MNQDTKKTKEKNWLTDEAIAEIKKEHTTGYGFDCCCAENEGDICCIEKLRTEIGEVIKAEHERTIKEILEGVEELIPPYKECKCDLPMDVCFIRVGVRETRKKIISFIKSKLTE